MAPPRPDAPSSLSGATELYAGQLGAALESKRTPERALGLQRELLLVNLSKGKGKGKRSTYSAALCAINGGRCKQRIDERVKKKKKCKKCKKAGGVG